MNITPQATTVPIATVVNPPTDNLRRENSLREVITQPTAPHQSAAEKSVASERERAKTPAQNNSQIDFAALQEQAELERSTINGREQNQDQSNSSKDAEQDTKPTEAENSEQATDTHDEHNHPDGELSFEQQQEISELQRRDLEVKSHEYAHASVGGPYTGAPSFSYEVGPDGKKYAVEGEVSVDLSPVDGNPRATIAKMQKVYAAALAPANPSVQDTRVAASASRIIAQAQSQLVEQELKAEQQSNGSTEIDANIRTNETFESDTNKNIGSNANSDNDFDQFVNATLQSQEQVAPTPNARNQDIDARAARIESFYSNINHAYEKSPRYQFELTA